MSGISTAAAKLINYNELNNTELEENCQTAKLIFNEENELWYMPVEPL